MLFVATLQARGLAPAETTARRANWTYPENVKVHAEYWCPGRSTVVSVFETDDPSAIMAINLAWADAFEIDVTPAITAQEGLALAASMGA